jgi:serine/threonine protein kinase/tetratricopeptide (TPR) repeat protein
MPPERRPGADAPTEPVPAPEVHETEPVAGSLAAGRKLEAGAQLEGRFRIVRMLGQGGMGEVYEAVDLALGTRVALKTVRLEQATNESALQRFRREILLARKIAHPNVCKVFELHVGGIGDLPLFLTMELLEGETLAARLRRLGRLDEEVAREIVRQIAAGLGAAHAEGVVHRDLKASNVMLVPAQGRGERAVVTDFGIAHALGGLSDVTATLDGPIGTPAYMAPEQVTGGAVTPATDFYCLGVLMYELTTGTLPFSGETPAQIAYRRLGVEPPDPSISNPGLSKGWTGLVRWCLAADPAERPQTTEAFRQALEGEASPPGGLSRRRLVTIVLALAATVAAIPSADSLRSPRAPATARPVVAVLEGANLTGDAGLDWLSTALSEAFASSLEPIRGIRIVPPRVVADRQFSLGVTTTPQLGTSDGPRRLAESVGASDIVELRFRRDKTGSLLFQAIVRPGAGRRAAPYEATFKPAASTEELGTPDEVEGIAGRLAESVRTQLRWERGDGDSRSPFIPSRPLPRDPDARRLYTQALRQVARYDAPGALSLVRRVQQREPDFLPAMTLRRYDALAFVGFQHHDGDLFERGLEHVADLPPASPERRLIEAVSPAALLKTGDAPQRLKSLLAQSPDDFELALLAAAVSPDFTQQLAPLRILPPPLGTDPRIDLVEASLRIDTGELAEAAAAIGRGLAEARRRGDRLTASQFLTQRGIVEMREGRSDDGVKSFLEAEREALAAGSSSLAREHRFVRASMLNESGRLNAARELYRQLLAEFRGLGEAWDGLRQRDLRQLAELEANLGRFEAAHEVAREMKNGAEMEHFLGLWEIRAGDTAPQREEGFRKEIRACRQEQCVWLWSTFLGVELGLQGRPADAMKLLGETGPIPDLWEQVGLYAQAMTDQGKAAEAYASVQAKVRDDTRTRGVITTYEAWRANQALAICLLGMRELDEAERVIARMARFHRSWDDVEGRALGLGLEAELALARGVVPPELPGLARAQLGVPEMRVFPRARVELKMHLGRLLVATGRAREGRAFLAEAIRESTDRGELRTARLARAALAQ